MDAAAQASDPANARRVRASISSCNDRTKRSRIDARDVRALVPQNWADNQSNR
jgi:hypothetical protein